MGTYEILSQSDCKGKTMYDVKLIASNGYSEIQQYWGDEKTLQEAADSFDKEVIRMGINV